MKKKSTHTGVWVFACANCDGLSESERRDAATCSPACRVAFHRSQRGAELRQIADSLQVTVASVGHVNAIKRLIPESLEKLTSGEKSIDALMPAAVAAFHKALFKLAELPE